MSGPSKITREFDSIGDMLRFIDATPANWESLASMTVDGKSDWYGTKDYPEAVRYATLGWPEGRARLASMQTAMSKVVRNVPVPAMSYDVAGAYPIVPAYIAGDPMHMVAPGEDYSATRPVVRFWVSIAGTAGISADTFTARGAAVLAWVDRLESAGYRCEVYAQNAYVSQSGPFKSAGFAVCLKAASQPVDLDRLAFGLMNPGMHRRLGFAFLERAGVQFKSMATGYGKNADVQPEHAANTVVIAGKTAYEDYWRTPAKATDYVGGLISQACGETMKLESAA